MYVFNHIVPLEDCRAARAVFHRIASEDDDGEVVERFWALPADAGLWKLVSIPFFATDLSLGDLVEVDPDGFIREVSARSGRRTLRIWLKDRSQIEIHGILDAIVRAGGLIERSSGHLYSIDAKTESIAVNVIELLEALNCMYEIAN